VFHQKASRNSADSENRSDREIESAADKEERSAARADEIDRRGAQNLNQVCQVKRRPVVDLRDD
jgi:hypothetical protein